MEENLIVSEELTTEAPVEVQEEVELTETPVEVRTYTDEDVDRIVQKRLARLEREHQKEMAKYKNTETILNAGLGTKSIDEASERLANFYREQGVEIPEVKLGLSDREIEILAKAEAEELVELGIEEMTREANELASKGYENLNKKEKVIFNTIAEKLTYETKKAELSKNGIKADILEDKDFQEFANKFNPRTSVVDIYSLYTKKIEKPKPIGSMTTVETQKVKEFYTMDEINRLTAKDYDDPQVMRAVELSLEKIYKDSH